MGISEKNFLFSATSFQKRRLSVPGFGVLGHVLLLPGMLLAAFIFVFTAVLCSLILLCSFWRKGEVMQMKAGSLGLQANEH